MSNAYIGIGSNIEPAENIRKALAMLSRETALTGISTFYMTEPLDRPGQPAFYNGVVRVAAGPDPRALKFSVLREIEQGLGRERSHDRSAPRTIDLDILIFDDLVIREGDLVIPDPDIEERPFLAIPLCELNSGLVMPGTGRVIRVIADKFSRHGMVPLHEYTDELRRTLLHEF
jgi:2-amino-4-hydroxy-6-hydroxymethyldihydropteridine diphosphokinase